MFESVAVAASFEALVQGVATDVAEGSVAQIVGQGDRLGQCLLASQSVGDGPGDLTHLQGVGEAGAEVVPLVVDEDLGFVLQASEGAGVDDPIPVSGEGVAKIGNGGVETVGALHFYSCFMYDMLDLANFIAKG